VALLAGETGRPINRGGSMSDVVPQGRNGGWGEKPNCWETGEYMGYELADLCL
jgi:hypothetical protein